MQLRVEPDGTILGLYDERMDLRNIGPVEIQRASQVEPQGATWTVDLTLSSGPRIDGFEKRSEALKAEIEWLKTNRL